ncbi:MAG: calcium-binding protein [Pikeienuella sp.]|uniref:calcium-binding protein n=1 Tax=Pikeienuella sp. TaxID=2831957 RepID=UPI00391C52C1
MTAPVTEIELNRLRNKIEVTFADGSVEEIENGIYERYDPRGRTVEERAATAADFARLEALVAGAGADALREVRLEDGSTVEFGPRKIEVTYPDGAQEEIENGIYERYDASGRTVEERLATEADIARLEALIPAEFRNVSDAAPVTGGAGPDRMRGDMTDDRMSGEGGDDRLIGRGGDDMLLGGSGEDRLIGGLGDDSLEGGADNDVLRGGQGRDTLSGDEGDDRLAGRGGDDSLLGGTGRDRMNGGAGDDTIEGGAGFDIYRGGKGADVFVFTADGARDVVRDFRPGEDVIDLSAFGLSGFPEVLDGASDRNGGVVLNLGDGDFIRLARVERDALSEGDFIL